MVKLDTRGTIFDVVLRVPQDRWLNWLAEGDWPGEPTTEEWGFKVGSLGNSRAAMRAAAPPGTEPLRCYVAAFGRLRGFAPVVQIHRTATGLKFVDRFVRAGGAVALTVSGLDLGKGRWCWAYRSWDRAAEVPFPAWVSEGLPPGLAASVHQLEAFRADPEKRTILRRRALAGFTKAADLFSRLG